MGDDARASWGFATPLHHGVYRILLDAAFVGGPSGRAGPDDPSPTEWTYILTEALATYPTEDQLLDTMTCGQGRERWDSLRPLARKLLQLVEPGSSPA